MIPLLVEGGLAAIQATAGIIQSIQGAKTAKALQKQLKPYQTPQELYDILNATKSNMSDTTMLDYVTGEINKSTASGLGTAARLGANPNQLSDLLGAKIDSLIKVGKENHQLNMQKFGQYLTALDQIGKSKDAERVSQNNLIKDRIQQAAGDKAQGMQNVGNAINSFTGAYSAYEIAKLGKPKNINNLNDYVPTNLQNYDVGDATGRRGAATRNEDGTYSYRSVTG